jgi:hypothetical protein
MKTSDEVTRWARHRGEVAVSDDFAAQVMTLIHERQRSPHLSLVSLMLAAAAALFIALCHASTTTLLLYAMTGVAQ